MKGFGVMRKRVLLITNDLSTVSGIQKELQNNDYEVMTSETCFSEVSEGNTTFLEAFDLIVLHQNLLKEIQQDCISKIQNVNKPAIILSVIGDQADNYFISYPVSSENISNEINDHLTKKLEHPIFINNNFGLDRKARHAIEVVNHKLIIDGTPVVLSRKEFQLFELLAAENYNLVDNQTIFREIWDTDYELLKQPFLSNLVMKIRKKVLSEVGIEESVIINKKGVGYCINDLYLILEKSTVNS